MNYYDRDEMTRPGHVPQLTTGGGGASGSCSCGWSVATSTTTAAMYEIHDHIALVDDEATR